MTVRYGLDGPGGIVFPGGIVSESRIAVLWQLPAYSFEFLRYLWVLLVGPVGVYGMELFSWAGADIAKF